MASDGSFSRGEEVMLPEIRTTSTPLADNSVAIRVARFEGLCRAAASDISTRFFNSSPGVVALGMVQENLVWAQEEMLKRGLTCPFEGERPSRWHIRQP